MLSKLPRFNISRAFKRTTSHSSKVTSFSELKTALVILVLILPYVKRKENPGDIFYLSIIYIISIKSVLSYPPSYRHIKIISDKLCQPPVTIIVGEYRRVSLQL